MVNLKIFKTYVMLKIWQHTIISILLILSKVKSGSCFDVNFDNRLSIKPRDCYTRVSIGSRLIESLVISTNPSVSISDCEATCSANGTSCGSFSFGVGARGNTTCLFGQGIPRQPEDLRADSDYDVYVKGRLSLRGCQPVRSTTTATLTNNSANQTSTDSTTNQVQIDANNNISSNSVLSINTNSQRLFGNTSFLNIFGNSILSRARTRNNDNNTIQYNPNEPFKTAILSPEPADDNRIRISDILKNQDSHYNHDSIVDDNFNQFNDYPSIENENIPFEYHQIDHSNYWIPTIDNKKLNPMINSFSLPIHSKIEPTIIYHDNLDNDFFKKLEFYPSFGDKIITPVDFEVQVNNPWLDVSDDKRPSLNEQSSIFDLSELDSTNKKKGK